MLLCETARSGRGDAEDLAVFASQLAALGVPARVAVGSVPANPSHNLQFDLAPRLVDDGLRPADGLALLAADRLDDAGLARLRRLAGEADVSARAFGCFARHQSELAVRAKLAYVLGREPELFDVSGGDPDAAHPAPAFGVPRPGATPDQTAKAGPPRVLLIGPMLSDPVQAAALAAMVPQRGLRAMVLTDSRSKHAWIAAHGYDIPFFHYGEVLPLALARRTDVCVFLSRIGRSYRLQTLLANLLVAGVPVLDGDTEHRLANANDAFVAAPPGVVGLASFLAAEILPNIARVAEIVRNSRAAAEAGAERVLRFLGVEAAPPSPRRRAAAAAVGGIVFMPTNGIGLGHAQRCALIASALSPEDPRPVFAAFPSCMRLVKSFGFDVMPLIGRSMLHVQSHEHDLANFQRLRTLAADARTLVFDGGYVFDSVYRTILEGGLKGVWIRRGLWQSGQDNSVALDREKVFDRVIVPGEAFEELNAALSTRTRVHKVGPVVNEIGLSPRARADLRARLATRYERSFDFLVVSLLGAGVAADRGMQIQALCGLFERRPDTLHLVLVWPSGRLEPGWFGWRNSRVVRTLQGVLLTAAADLAITASGYNSFHEALYNRVPAIFMPQLAPSTDDQRARARAACDRGLAAMLGPTELMSMERLVTRHLDGGEGEAVRARLAAAELPETGTRRAAQLIEEVTFGQDAVGYDSLPDRSKGRG